MKWRHAAFCRRAVSVLCALALVLVAFAHRPPAADAQARDTALASWLATGGSLADLCLPGESGGDHHDRDPCPACTLAKSIAPAPADCAPLARVSWPDQCAVPETARPASQHAARASPPRGPPALHAI